MSHKRRRFYHLKTPARFKFIRFVVGAMVAAFLINTAIMLRLFSQTIDNLGPQLNPYIFIQLNFVGIMIIFSITLLWVMHHGFGALARMENILEQIINGDFSFRMHLRKADIMRPFAEKLNKILDMLERSKDEK